MIIESEQITPDWLADVFRKNRLPGADKIVDVRITLTKTLHVSDVAQLEVEYLTDAPVTTPSKLFLKLSKTGSAFSDTGSEVEFYHTIGAEMNGPPLIKCYDADFSRKARRSYILMEDLSDTHFQPESPHAPSLFYSELAVQCLARFHAYWWEHPKLGNEIGKVFNEAWLKGFMAGLEDSVGKFLSFLGDELSAQRRKTYERMLLSSNKIWGRLTNTVGLTVTHGDMHWWNFLYPLDANTHQMRVFDWQLWHIDLGARDLAFLVALGGFAKRRPEIEMRLLHVYHDTLRANGVKDYSWTGFWEDYRWSAIRNLNIPVIFWSQGKDRETWNTMLGLSFQSYDDLCCEDLLNT